MTSSDISFASHANAFGPSVSLAEMRNRAPAIFAESPHERVSSKYTFIPTERVLTGLMEAGFVPVEARQARTRRASLLHARHVIRLRRRRESVQLDDSIPEIVFLNSHDGTSAYQLRVGLYRVVCTNGLIVSPNAFPAFKVSHRRDVVDEAIAGALELATRFSDVGARVEEMQRRRLEAPERIRFAERALALRYPDQNGFAPSRLLSLRRVEDEGDSLWLIFNRVQENLLRGGLYRVLANGRLSPMRRITSIREDVRLNTALWDLAMEQLAA